MLFFFNENTRKINTTYLPREKLMIFLKSNYKELKNETPYAYTWTPWSAKKNFIYTFFANFLSAGAVAVRVRKKRLGADNNNSKMMCAVTA